MQVIKGCGLLILAVWLGLMAGCDRSGSEPDQASSSSSSTAPDYVAPDPGYLKSAVFELSEQGQLANWTLLQHSSDTSYSVTVDDGVLSLTRTGDEPWGKVRQLLKGDAVKPLLGKTLKFSADIKADFTSQWGEAMEPPAMTVLVKGVRVGAPAMLGKSIIVSKKTPVSDLSMGVSWHRYSVEFTLPTAAEVRGIDLELSFLMTEGGTMYVRGPALIEASE
ncbi:hypothetical protein QWI17_18800 [Gilvimarinus sp. SDUM040013]|uniref:Uncharacterized protein n=1 Tax=Gilvimarinus gilvus TaxID=3058038 RepID=A0ABU4RV20_9GAMM|nr:hypothetical protein [Gilvimarinus sp. SDUM040013]MDO3387901.1 hypothetical protein [Gilvimarinus sp. SDUM040013]MDX6848728.1 hypothetical protein [Gilvimarinus sp. SDUM040013]